MIDVGGVDRSVGDSGPWTDPTWRDLVEERLRVTLPWYRSWITGRATAEWMRRVSAASPVAPDAGLRTMTRLERAIALASVALAESPAVVMLDVPEAFAHRDDERAFLDAVAAIARPGTTIVVGSAEPFAVAGREVAVREIVRIDLNALRRVPAAVSTASSDTATSSSREGSRP
jgi:RND superfamily putative drug exporter